MMVINKDTIIMGQMPFLFHVRPIQIEKMWQVYFFFYVFFWLFGEKYIPFAVIL